MFEQADCHIKPSTLFGIGLLLASLGVTASCAGAGAAGSSLPINGLVLFSLPWLWLLEQAARRG